MISAKKLNTLASVRQAIEFDRHGRATLYGQAFSLYIGIDSVTTRDDGDKANPRHVTVIEAFCRYDARVKVGQEITINGLVLLITQPPVNVDLANRRLNLHCESK